MSSQNFKTSVGETYEARNGSKVKIVDIESMIPPVSVPGAPYVGDNGKFYSEDGRESNGTVDSDLDLVRHLD